MYRIHHVPACSNQPAWPLRGIGLGCTPIIVVSENLFSSREKQTPSDDSRLTSSSSLSGTARDIKISALASHGNRCVGSSQFSRGFPASEQFQLAQGAVESAGGFPASEQFQLAQGAVKSAGDSRHPSSFSWRREQSSQQGIPGIRAV